MTIPSNRPIILEGEAINENQSQTTTNTVNTPRALNSSGEQVSVTQRVATPPTGSVIFEVQPTVSESGAASYFEIGDIRQAANILIYMGSPSREFSINGRFVSRTVEEADRNLRYVRYLRAWRMPEKKGRNELNKLETPSRLKLRGFGNWYNSIHVRITSLNIEMPEDVDYIRAENGADVPIVWPVSVTLKETRSEIELREFDIGSFREGTLSGW